MLRSVSWSTESWPPAIDIQLRTLNSDDHQAYRQLRLEMLREEPIAFGADYDSTASLPEQHFRDRTQYAADNFIIGAFAAADLVGSCGGRREQGFKRQHIGYIWGMYLQTQHRGTGTAAAMLNAAIEGLKQLPGLELIQLAVTAGNRSAEQLYLNAGFQEYGVERAALKVDGKNFDERLMWRPLEPR